MMMMMRKCQVCFQGHKKIPKTNYKTSVICPPCKSFFFRAAVFNKYSSYVCQEGQSCRIGHGRSCCKKCRYERCLKVSQTEPQTSRIMANDSEVDLDTLLKGGNAIMIDEETEQFFDDLYKECVCK